MSSDKVPLLNGKVALVTGASRGIGAAIAGVLASQGAQVTITARHDKELEATASAIGESAYPVVAHSGDPDQAAKCVSDTIERFGALDILVNGAATNPYFGPLIDVDLSRYDKTLEVNLRGPLVWMQQAWRQFMEHSGGAIVNIASIGGLEFVGPLGVYDVSKAGLIHMTKHLATELGPKVRVNAIAPGVIKTEFSRALWDDHPADKPWPWALERIGLPEDVASAALYLASRLSDWVTGQVLVVDGGKVLGVDAAHARSSVEEDAS